MNKPMTRKTFRVLLVCFWFFCLFIAAWWWTSSREEDHSFTNVHTMANTASATQRPTQMIRKKPMSITVNCDGTVERCEQCYKCRPQLSCQSNADCCSFDETCTPQGLCETSFSCGGGGDCGNTWCPERYYCVDMCGNEVEHGNGGCEGPSSPECRLLL